MNDEFQPDEAAKDLLGDPMDQRRETWGRPGFKKTKQNQEVVEVLKASGWSNERIARHIGCDVKTLRKHFSLELSEAPDRAEAQALLAIFKRMKSGNVTAANRILALAERGRAAPPPPKDDPEPEQDEAEEGAALGKKERLAQAAKNPIGGWGNLLN